MEVKLALKKWVRGFQRLAAATRPSWDKPGVPVPYLPSEELRLELFQSADPCVVIDLCEVAPDLDAEDLEFGSPPVECMVVDELSVAQEEQLLLDQVFVPATVDSPSISAAVPRDTHDIPVAPRAAASTLPLPPGLAIPPKPLAPATVVSQARAVPSRTAPSTSLVGPSVQAPSPHDVSEAFPALLAKLATMEEMMQSLKSAAPVQPGPSAPFSSAGPSQGDAWDTRSDCSSQTSLPPFNELPQQTEGNPWTPCTGTRKWAGCLYGTMV